MFIKRKKNRSGTISVVVAEKQNGMYRELTTIGIAKSDEEIEALIRQGHEWIEREQRRRHPRLDLFGEERNRCEQELMNAEQLLSNITNITIDGADLILDRVFDNVGFNRIEDEIFRKLVKAYRRGTLSKDHINKRGYNKFLSMQGDVKVAIDYEKIEEDASWDGLKGYLTNTDIPASQVYAAYHNLWHVERAFRISKSKIEIRPMFHFTRRRIEAHVCICFVALKVYKELERLLKQADINMSVDKILALAQIIVTIQLNLPQNKQTISRTMLMKHHQRIAPLFSDDFWGTH